jgi:macrolide-specific efflux system membrane fusion protein
MHNKFRLKKRYLALAIILLVGACWLLFGKGHSGSDTKQRLATVTTGTVEDVVTAQGKLEPKEYVDVGLQVSGQIMKLHVDVGDEATKDELLAEIDPRIYQSRLDADEAQLHSLQAQADEQQANLVLAEQQQARNAIMIKTHAVSKDAFDQSVSALKVAQAKLHSIKAQIDQINSTITADKTNLTYTKIYAPMSGTIGSLPVREGQTLNAVQSAPTLMRISNLEVMTVRAQVAEADIPHLKPNMPAYFTTLGDLERRYNGTVRLIQPSPEIVNDVVLYDVLIDSENKEHRLMDGMSTQVFFVLGKAENVPVLPLEALGKRLPKEDNAQGKAYQVHLVGKSDPITVHVGLSDRTQAEIKDGLKEGDQVVIQNREKSGNGGAGHRTGGMPPGMGGPKL